MRIIDVSQATETDAWLEARRCRITGTKSGALALEHYAQTDVQHIRDMADRKLEAAKKAKTEEKKTEYEAAASTYEDKANLAELENQRYKVPQDFWQYLAELLAEQADGENPMERGHRLENENASILLQKLNIPDDQANYDTGLWVDDTEPRLACSPDVTELSLEPTWAIECKSLGTANHLKAVIPFLAHEKLYDGEDHVVLPKIALQILPEVARDANALGFDFIPENYQPQVLQYFVVNESLKTLYFTLYDPRVYDSKLSHVYITVHRDDIEDRIKAHREAELTTLKLVDGLTEQLGLEVPSEA